MRRVATGQRSHISNSTGVRQPRPVSNHFVCCVLSVHWTGFIDGAWFSFMMLFHRKMSEKCKLSVRATAAAAAADCVLTWGKLFDMFESLVMCFMRPVHNSLMNLFNCLHVKIALNNMGFNTRETKLARQESDVCLPLNLPAYIPLCKYALRVPVVTLSWCRQW